MDGGGLLVVHAARPGPSSAVIGGDSASVYLPDSLVRLLLVRRGGESGVGPGRPCSVAVLTELAVSPFTWARHHERVRRSRDQCWVISNDIKSDFFWKNLAEWTCGGVEPVQVRHEEKVPRRLPR